jgi:hypothetical protein
LRNLKSESKKTLVGERFGLYGVELGAYSALKAARGNDLIKVLVLDSIARSPKELLSTAVKDCAGVDNSLVQFFSQAAMRLYLMNSFDTSTACESAIAIRNQRVLLLSGPEAGQLRDATASLQQCFDQSVTIEARTDLPLSGFNLPSATGEQGEAYDRVVIDFFDRNLR